MHNLANVYFSQGRYSLAEALHCQTMDARRRVLGSDHPDTLTSMHDVAAVYGAQGKYAQAEALDSQIVEIKRRVLGPENSGTLNSMISLARTYTPQGKYPQAEALFRRIRDIRLRVLGTEHKSTIYCLTDLAMVYARQGKYALARTYAEQALVEQRHVLGPEHPDILDSITELGLYCQLEAEFAESETLARQALDSDRKIRPDHWRRFQAESLLGASLAGQKKYAEAEALLLDGYRGMMAPKDRREVPDPYYLDRAREWIVQFYQASGKRKEAAEWRKQGYRNLQDLLALGSTSSEDRSMSPAQIQNMLANPVVRRQVIKRE
jgi:tetratricopeptide (TPR) repeat protein